MNCDDCQNWLAGDDKAANSTAEMHLAQCCVCKTFQSSLELLDAELTRQAARASLPPDFDSQVLLQTVGRAGVLSPERIASLRSEWEREYNDRLAEVSPWKVFRQPWFYLRTAALASLSVAGFWLVPDIVSALAAGMESVSIPPINLIGIAAVAAMSLGLLFISSVRHHGSGLVAQWIAGVFELPLAPWEQARE